MKKFFTVLICIVLTFCVVSASGAAVSAVSLFNIGCNAFRTLDTKKEIVPGVIEEHIVTYKKENAGRNDNYVATIDMASGKVGMLAGYANYDSSGKWAKQTVIKQAKAAESATGKKIVAAFNGDFFLSSGEPVNMLIMNGKKVKSSTSNYYFAILKDGTPVIRKSTVSTSDVLEAVGTNNLLLSGGTIKASKNSTELAPRTAVGITADGQVKILVVDGRNSPTSVGYTLYETAEMMLSLGCVDALNLDGGGSSTFCTGAKGADSLKVKNNPSDGQARAVSSTLLFYQIVKEEKPEPVEPEQPEQPDEPVEPVQEESFLMKVIRILNAILEFILKLFESEVPVTE